MNKSFIIKVFGRVQGVGFRYFVHKNAILYGLKGFVKNMSNGSVYIEAEGNADGLKYFVETLKEGNSMSRTDEITTQEQDFRNFAEFSILH